MIACGNPAHTDITWAGVTEQHHHETVNEVAQCWADYYAYDAALPSMEEMMDEEDRKVELALMRREETPLR